MVRTDASPIIKRILAHYPICPICGSRVESFEDFQYLKVRNGRRICYSFFHTNCILNYERGVRNAEEERFQA